MPRGRERGTFMPDLYDVAAIGNAIVDVIAPATDAFLADNSLTKGAMMLVDPDQSAALYGKMAAGVETSGGSAGNTIAGVASFGGKAAFLGKVADTSTLVLPIHFPSPTVGLIKPYGKDGFDYKFVR